MVTKCDYLNPPFLLHLLVEFLLQGITLPFNLFMDVCVFMWAHGFLFYPMDYNPLLSLFILMLKLSKIWSVEPCVLLAIPVTEPLLLSPQDALGFSCISPAPALDSLKFPRSPMFLIFEFFVCLFLVGAKCVHCYRGVISVPSPLYKKYSVTVSLPSWNEIKPHIFL